MEWSISPTRLVALVLFTGVTMDIIRRILRNRTDRKGCPLPPGPTPLPFLGSALSLHGPLMRLTFTEWRKKYGDIMYIRVFGTDLIILNSTSVATELLDQRSEIYSDRPASTTVVAPYYDFHFGFAQYGEQWKVGRRIFHQTFRAEAAMRFRPMQLLRARQLISNIVDCPDKYSSHFSRFSASVALSATYDYELGPRSDPMMSIVENFLRLAVPGIAPQRLYLVQAFPFLLYMPEWLPGSWITREVKEAFMWRNKLVEMPYQHIQERMESKSRLDTSMILDHISRMEQSGDLNHAEYETALKHASATSLIAASNTTASTLMAFTLAMVENPHIWKRAQAEIDAAVGMDRLPEFHDRLSLPYVEAIVREVFRWRPALPLNAPHAVTRSDVYNGYYIPGGATIIINTWAMSRDKDRYPDGDRFIPERYLDAEGKLTDDDPTDFTFGFGRRMCPGRHVADASVWSAAATMLATLDFNLAKDANGNDIKFKATFAHGIVERPDPFPCRLTLRPHAKELLDCVLRE